MVVGLTEVEPLPDCELKLPGEIESAVAPLADQLSVLLPPEAIVVGLALNEAMEGAEVVPPFEPVLVDEPEPLFDQLLDTTFVPFPDEFVELPVRPHAAIPTQIASAEISAPRESFTNRTARLETGDPMATHIRLAYRWAYRRDTGLKDRIGRSPRRGWLSQSLGHFPIPYSIYANGILKMTTESATVSWCLLCREASDARSGSGGASPR